MHHNLQHSNFIYEEKLGIISLLIKHELQQYPVAEGSIKQNQNMLLCDNQKKSEQTDK